MDPRVSYTPDKKSKLYRIARTRALELGTLLRKWANESQTPGAAIDALGGAIAGLAAALCTRPPCMSRETLMELAYRAAVDIEITQALKYANASVDEALNSGDGSYKP